MAQTPEMPGPIVHFVRDTRGRAFLIGELVSLPITPKELQAPEVLRGQRREWRFERAGWLFMALLMAGGLAGAFGGGPLAHAAVSTGSSRLDFDRLVRHGVPTELRLTIGASPNTTGRLRVSLDWSYLEAVNLLEVIPQPMSTVSSADRVAWEFEADATGNRIVIKVEPTKVGAREGRLQIGGGTLQFRQFVYP